MINYFPVHKEKSSYRYEPWYHWYPLLEKIIGGSSHRRCVSGPIRLRVCLIKPNETANQALYCTCLVLTFADKMDVLVRAELRVLIDIGLGGCNLTNLSAGLSNAEIVLFVLFGRDDITF